MSAKRSGEQDTRSALLLAEPVFVDPRFDEGWGALGWHAMAFIAGQAVAEVTEETREAALSACAAALARKGVALAPRPDTNADAGSPVADAGSPVADAASETLISEPIVARALEHFTSFSSDTEQAMREVMRCALEAVAGDIIERFAAAGRRQPAEHDPERTSR